MDQAHIATAQVPVAQTVFVLATQVSKQGQLTYAVQAHRSGQPTTAELCSSTAGRGGGNTNKPSHIDSSQNPLHQNSDLCLCAMLAWETASRWDDVIAVCEGDPHRGEWIGTPYRRGAGGPLHAVEVGDRRARRGLQPSRRYEALPLPYRDHHRGTDGDVAPHSIKRGAVTHLLALLVEKNPVNPSLISVLASIRWR